MNRFFTPGEGGSMNGQEAGGATVAGVGLAQIHAEQMQAPGCNEVVLWGVQQG